MWWDVSSRYNAHPPQSSPCSWDKIVWFKDTDFMASSLRHHTHGWSPLASERKVIVRSRQHLWGRGPKEKLSSVPSPESHRGPTDQGLGTVIGVFTWHTSSQRFRWQKDRGLTQLSQSATVNTVATEGGIVNVFCPPSFLVSYGLATCASAPQTL